jgi:hypothetical protein
MKNPKITINAVVCYKLIEGVQTSKRQRVTDLSEEAVRNKKTNNGFMDVLIPVSRIP